MTFRGTFDDHRILRPLINFWGLWGRLEYLGWTSEDFEGFEDLLRNLRTFCGSVEKLRSEDLGYLSCSFLIFSRLCGPFEGFLKTWGAEDLRTLKNFSGPLDDFLWTFWVLFIGNFSGRCWDHLMTFPGTFEDGRISSTLITFWGLWSRLEYLLWTSEVSEGFEDLLRNMRTFWGSVEKLRPEDLGYLLCIFLTFSGLCGPFKGLFEELSTWCSLNIEEPSRKFWWLLVDLLRTWDIWGFQGLFRILRICANQITYWGPWGRW